MRAIEAADRVEAIAIQALREPLKADLLRGGTAVFGIVGEAKDRMLGVGADQYDEGEGQKFERMKPSELLAGAREEMLDLINYAAMAIIQIDDTARTLEIAEEGVLDTVRALYT